MISHLPSMNGLLGWLAQHYPGREQEMVDLIRHHGTFDASWYYKLPLEGDDFESLAQVHVTSELATLGEELVSAGIVALYEITDFFPYERETGVELVSVPQETWGWVTDGEGDPVWTQTIEMVDVERPVTEIVEPDPEMVALWDAFVPAAKYPHIFATTVRALPRDQQ